MPIDFNSRWNIYQRVFKSNIATLWLASGNLKRSKVKNTSCNIRPDGISPLDFHWTSVKCMCSNLSGYPDTDPILSRPGTNSFVASNWKLSFTWVLINSTKCGTPSVDPSETLIMEYRSISSESHKGETYQEGKTEKFLTRRRGIIDWRSWGTESGRQTPFYGHRVLSRRYLTIPLGIEGTRQA